MNKTYIKQKIKQEKRQEVQENPFVSLSSDQYIPFDLNGVHLNTLIDFSLKIERILWKLKGFNISTLLQSSFLYLSCGLCYICNQVFVKYSKQWGRAGK